MYSATAIIPKNTLSIAAQEAALRRALDKSAGQTTVKLERVTSSWKTLVTFDEVSPSDYERTITTQSDIFLFNDLGTKAHRINPRRKRYLRFRGRSGNYVFSRGVNHPGTKPKYMSRTVAKDMQTVLQQNVTAAISEATNG